MKLTDPAAWLSEYGIEVSDGMTLCPFHDDHNPSCNVSIEKQCFICKACGAHGDLTYLMAQKHGVSKLAVEHHVKGVESSTTISQSSVEAWHKLLVVNKAKLAILRERKGITLDTIRKHKLGLDGDRITIPIYNENRDVINVRKWSPTDKKQKVLNYKGGVSKALYPIEAFEEKIVYLTEGELKALCLRERGLNGVSGTGGAGTWSSDWKSYFVDKTVYIVYDIDSPGSTGAIRAARDLHAVAESVHIVKLPIDPKEIPTGGIDDFLTKLNHDAKDFLRICEQTAKYVPVSLLQREPDDPEIYPVHLSRASLAQYSEKFVRVEAVVCAKDTTPYEVPKEFLVACSRGKDECAVCPLQTLNNDFIHAIDNRNPILLSFIKTPDYKLVAAMKRSVGIPYSCKDSSVSIKSKWNIEDVHLMPQLKTANSNEDHVTRRALFVGLGIESNSSYTVEARATVDPNTQYAALLMYEAKQTVDSLGSFALTDGMKKQLKAFQPKAWTVEAMQKKLDSIYEDLENNVTRIYKRRELHLAYDLIYHSVLLIPFQGKVIKGWVEGLVIGDSGTGKSETFNCLLAHYNLGEKIDGKGCSIAGLKGGCQQLEKGWYITWGKIPLSDRRLLAIDEAKGMPLDVIASLTEMRSSGKAQLSKIEKLETNARTRLVMITNPRSDRQLISYSHGVKAVKEFVGALEDVRRYDLAILTASGDVPRDMLNIRDEDRPKVKHEFTSDLCRNLILWAWSRVETQVQILPDAVNAILEGAKAMGQAFSSAIPLVEESDQRLKLARLATSLAARTYSTDDGETVVVRKCHAEYVVKFLTDVYSSKVFGYLDFSKAKKAEQEIIDPVYVSKVLRELPYAKTACEKFLNAETFTLWDFMDWTELDRETANRFWSVFVRHNAITHNKTKFYKSPAFIGLLKGLGKLTNVGLAEETEL